jgi:hypothetical protein
MIPIFSISLFLPSALVCLRYERQYLYTKIDVEACCEDSWF